MILVTLGTFPTQFQRPLLALEDLCDRHIISEAVIVQNGHTQFESGFMQMRPFIPPDELTELSEKARIIISHAGTGSLIKGIKLGKKVIAIARRAKYTEMVDDHQVELLELFAEKNYVLPWWEDNTLENLLEKVEAFTPQPYISKKHVIIDYLEQYINSL